MTESLLVLDDVRTTLATARGSLTAVDGVSLSVARGEALAIVGESGSGKSVLMRTVMRLLPERARVSGRVLLEGRDLAGLRPAELRRIWGRTIAMSFQDSMTSLNPVRRIGDQIADPLRRHLGLGRRAALARARDVLELVRIGDPDRRLRQYPHELSGGMRQRVMIAIAIACRPALLIADEPTTALDVTVQKEILDLIAGLRRELGMALVLISHDLEVVRDRAERIAVMYAGRVVETGPTEQIFTAPSHPYTAALLAATPSVELAPGERFRTIPGQPPDLLAPPPGCQFAPRCAFATERCTAAVPELPPGDGAACFHPLRHVAAVPR